MRQSGTQGEPKRDPSIGLLAPKVWCPHYMTSQIRLGRCLKIHNHVPGVAGGTCGAWATWGAGN